jgi:hypothetical protein
MASMAVLGTLYNKQHNIKNVLAIFVSSAASSFRHSKFTLFDLTEKINEMFEFELPQYLVKTIIRDELKQSIELSYGHYHNINQINTESISDLDNQANQIQKEHENIFLELEKYVETIKNFALFPAERKKLFHEFSCYILNIANGNEYNDIISAFIIKNERNENFQKNLSTIKEGLILYTGVKYGGITSAQTHLDGNLIIFLEQEILFNLAHLNGESFYLITKELIDFVSTINQVSHKYKIELKYLRNTEAQIQEFFTAAESILRNKRRLAYMQTAMETILKDCETPNDVITKQIEFYQILRKLKITLDTTNFVNLHENPDYYKYNIIDESLTSFVKESSQEDRLDKLEILNNILYLRKDLVGRTLDNSRYLVATGTNDTLKISRKIFEEQRKIGAASNTQNHYFFPTALHISDLITWLWFKVNKGFGGSTLPETFNIITKAQITLNTKMNIKFEQEYQKVNMQLQNGMLDEKTAQERIFELRNRINLRPNIITSDNIEEVEDLILSDDMISRIAEQRALDNHKNKNTLTELLEAKTSLKEREISDLEDKKALIESKLTELSTAKIKVDKSTTIRFLYTRIALFVLTIIYAIYFRVNWELLHLESVFWILTSIPVFFTIIFPRPRKVIMDFLEKNFVNPPKSLYAKYSKKYKYSSVEQTKLEQEISDINSDIQTLRDTLVTFSQTG